LITCPLRRSRIPGRTARIIRDSAEHVGLEHPTDFRLVSFFDICEIPDSGVVHQHVDAAEVLLGTPHRLSDLCRVGDVQLQCQRPIAVSGNKVFDLSRVPGRHHRTIPAGQYRPGQLTPEPRRTPGDQPRR